MKRVSEVFSDYKVGKNISDAMVEKAVLKRKSKVLVMNISSNKYIDAEEIRELNNFIRKRFILNDSKINVIYTEEVKQKPIEEEIKNIVLTITEKHPVLKAAACNLSLIHISRAMINFRCRITPYNSFSR